MMFARSHGYLGGAGLSQRERRPLIARNIDHLPVINLDWKHQCRCGGFLYSTWRSRFVCRRCGRWFSKAPS